MKMNRKAVWIVALGIVLIGILIAVIYPCFSLQTKEEACLQMYSVLKEEIFSRAEVEDGFIALYDPEGVLLGNIPDGTNCRFVKYILFENNQYYFILHRSVDDTEGILISPDNSVCMDGLSGIKRLGGNTYYFQTN